MTAWRRVIELSISSDADVAKLMSVGAVADGTGGPGLNEPVYCWVTAEIPRSLQSPEFWDCAIRQFSGGLSEPRPTGPLVTLDDCPRSGKEPKITVGAKEWLASLPGGEGPAISQRVVDDPEERRDPKGRGCNFTAKSKILKETAVASKKKPGDAVSIISYDEKPGIQALPPRH